MKADRKKLADLLTSGSLMFDDPSSLQVYSTDQGEVPAALKAMLVPDTRPGIVVQPGSIEDLQTTVRYANESNIPLVPRGVSSFGLGGAVAHQRGILLDFSGKREIYDFDPQNGTIRTSAGCRWSDVSAYLNARGFEICTYPTSWFSTTAGWAATGGIGIGSTAFGSFHNRIQSLTVVNPTGQIQIHDRSSDEITNFLGTEGQMGAIWDLTFSVRKKPKVQVPVLIACESITTAMNVASAILDKFRPYHMKFSSRSRIHEINHLLYEEHPVLKPRIQIKESEMILCCFESMEELERLKAWARTQHLEVISDFQAHYLWRERMFPLRVKRIAPGLLASEMILPLDCASKYAEFAEDLGRKFHVNLALEAYFLPDKKVLMLPVYTFRTTGFVDQSFKAALSYVLTSAGIKLGGRPYGTGIWNTPFVRSRFGSSFKSLKQYKRSIDPSALFNPGKFFELKFSSNVSRMFASFAMRQSFLNVLSPVLSILAPVFTSESAGAQSLKNLILKNEELCSKCGSCVAVCPAYIETRDERTTARGKLQIGKSILEGRQISSAEAEFLSLCMHCGICSDVCQSRLDLVPVWDELESQVQLTYGRNSELIGEFVKSVQEKKIMEVPYARGVKVLTGTED